MRNLFLLLVTFLMTASGFAQFGSNPTKYNPNDVGLDYVSPGRIVYNAKFTWTENFKEDDNESVLKKALTCSAGDNLNGCKGVCEVQNKLPKNFLASTRIDGKKVGNFLVDLKKETSSHIKVQSAIKEYSELVRQSAQAIPHLQDREDCKNYVLKQEDKTDNKVSFLEFLSTIQRNSHIPDFSRRSIECVGQIVDGYAFDAINESEQEATRILIERYNRAKPLISSRASEDPRNRQLIKIHRCLITKATELCNNITGNKKLAEQSVQDTLKRKRKEVLDELRGSAMRMTNQEIDANFGSLFDNQSDKTDASFDFVSALATDAIFANCLNSTNQEKCLKENSEKVGKILVGKKTPELTQILKTSPELATVGSDLKKFQDTIASVRKISPADREKEIYFKGLNCLTSNTSLYEPTSVPAASQPVLPGPAAGSRR